MTDCMCPRAVISYSHVRCVTVRPQTVFEQRRQNSPLRAVAVHEDSTEIPILYVLLRTVVERSPLPPPKQKRASSWFYITIEVLYHSTRLHNVFHIQPSYCSIVQPLATIHTCDATKACPNGWRGARRSTPYYVMSHQNIRSALVPLRT